MVAATVALEDTALLLLSERLALECEGAEAAKKWSAATARALVELVASHKGQIEDGDVCLLRDVKLRFKSAGIGTIGGREKAIAAIQSFLTPKAKPKSEDRAFIHKEFLKAAQAGALFEMTQMLTAHPSVVAARSSSKGYTAMHYAAMAGAIPVLDWLVFAGVSPDAVSSPSDGSPRVTPSDVAREYKREAALERLRLLVEGHAFLKSIGGAATCLCCA